VAARLTAWSSPRPWAPQNVNFALKSAVVRNFLDSSHIAYTIAAPRSDLSAANIGDVARGFTVRVECRQ
jgi:serine protease Do